MQAKKKDETNACAFTHSTYITAETYTLWQFLKEKIKTFYKISADITYKW